jgi:hypothetical protein
VELVGFLFFLFSEGCQVADPSLMSNLIGLLLDGVPPREPFGKLLRRF